MKKNGTKERGEETIMNPDLEKAQSLLQSENKTCVLCKDDKIYSSTLRGVKPLVQWLAEEIDVEGFSAADKVIGKATAYLYVLLKVKNVYAQVISKGALAVLKDWGIEVQYGTLVENIINRKGDGICPFEAAVWDIQEPVTAYEEIRKKMKELNITIQGEKMSKLGNVFILGDSYSTFEGYIPEGYAPYYVNAERSDCGVNKVEQTWWHRLIKDTGADLVMNCSYSGTTICNTGYEKSDCKEISFIGRLDKLIASGYFHEHKVDTFFIFGGTNDSWADSPVGELKYEGWTQEELYQVLPAFGYLLHRLKTNLPNARIITLINTEIKSVIMESLKEASEKCGVEAISFQVIDKVNGHPTDKGMKDIEDQILAHIGE